MADLQAILERQTSKVEELRQQAESEPTVASLQALASIYRDRAETFAGLGQHDEALEDRQAAATLLAQLVLGAGRDDLVEHFVDVGEKLREQLASLGRKDEALDQALSETQVVAATGQAARAIAQIRRVVGEQEAALRQEASVENLDRLLKALSVLSGTLFAAEKAEEALAVEDRAVDAVRAFQPEQPDRLASVRSNRALTRAALGNTDEALAELDEVVASYDQLVVGGDGTHLAAAAEARSRRGQVLLQQNKVDEGIATLQETVAFVELHAKEGDQEGAALLRSTLRHLTQAARSGSKLDEAFVAAERWAALAQTLADQGGDLTSVEELLEAATERALVLHLLGRNDLAFEDANQIVETWDRLAQAQPGRLDVLQRVMMALDLRERIAGALGKHEEALADQTAIINMTQQLLQRGAPPQLIQGLLVSLQRRAATLKALGRNLEAQQDLDILKQLVQRMTQQPPGGGAGPGGAGGPLGGGAGGGGLGGGGGTSGGGIII
ncbi:hypothetical protein [Vulgatibacter sp.]|uniref:hypothetical protein n=1 Tax=Vulgatibacter sp. TaxID=1971226 RepID=UPI003567C471